MDQPPDNPDLSIALDLARDQLGYRLSAVDGLDAKTAGLFGAACALAAILVALAALRTAEVSNVWGILTGSWVVASWVTAAACTYRATWASDYQFGPDPHDQAIYAADNPAPDAQKYALVTLIACIAHNAGRQKDKAWLVNACLLALASETVALLAFGIALIKG
jgi:hypothetical protein